MQTFRICHYIWRALPSSDTCKLQFCVCMVMCMCLWPCIFMILHVNVITCCYKIVQIKLKTETWQLLCIFMSSVLLVAHRCCQIFYINNKKKHDGFVTPNQSADFLIMPNRILLWIFSVLSCDSKANILFNKLKQAPSGHERSFPIAFGKKK